MERLGYAATSPTYVCCMCSNQTVAGAHSYRHFSKIHDEISGINTEADRDGQNR
jgi:hypothetical protein